MTGEPEPNKKQPSPQNWLQRWLTHARNRTAGDTIGAEIGPNARNVVVGKNVIQIGRLELPFYLAVPLVVGLLIIIGLLVKLALGRDSTEQNVQQANQGIQQIAAKVNATATPTPLPSATSLPTATPSPTATPTRIPMQAGSALKIAIAQFGQIDAQGNVQPDQVGSNISLWLAERLSQAFGAAIGSDQALVVQLRHDHLNAPPGDRPIGALANEQAAEQVRKELNADLLIYGNLTADETPHLQLDFVYVAKQVKTEPDAAVGYQRMGTPIVLRHARDGLYQEELEKSEWVAIRTQVLIWLARGLAQDLADDHRKALETFLQAEQALKSWDKKDGKEVLYYFQGREALALLEAEGPFAITRQAGQVTVQEGGAAQNAIETGATLPLQRLALAESAFLTATQIQPNFINAYLGLGSVDFQRTQLYLLAGQQTLSEVAACTTPLDLSQTKSMEQLPTTPEAAAATIDRAIQRFQLASDKADQDQDAAAAWPPLPAVAKVMLGSAHRLKAELDLRLDQLGAANAELSKAEPLLAMTLQRFTDDKQIGFLAYTQYGLGHVYRAGGYINERRQNLTEAKKQFEQARDSYAQCAALQAIPNPDGDRRMQEQVGCYCQSWELNVLQELGKFPGGSG